MSRGTHVPALAVHGGAGPVPDAEREERRLAVERGLDAGWSLIGRGALEACVAAVRQLEDEPSLNAGIGAALNADGEVELDAAVMDGDGLRTGAVALLRDVRHPVDLAVAVMEDRRHVLLAGEGASRFARAHGVELCDPSLFITARRRERWRDRPGAAVDTVGAVARDAAGHLAVAVSTGGVQGKLPGRIGDSPLAGAGFYADDEVGAACATGVGESMVRTVLCKVAVDLLRTASSQRSADAALDHLRRRIGATGGIIVLGREGEPAAACSTDWMPWAQRTGD